MRTSRVAFAGGHTSVKLYFMLGLPTETLDDVAGIARAGARSVVDTFYCRNARASPKGKGVNVSPSACATFVPKPFTPFQWEPQDDIDTIEQKQAHLVSQVKTRKISVSWHDSDVSFLEGVFARGDRRLGAVLRAAYEAGCYFEQLERAFFAGALAYRGFRPMRDRPGLFRPGADGATTRCCLGIASDDGIRKEFFVRESERARLGVTTQNCFEQCAGCGADRLDKEACHG